MISHAFILTRFKTFLRQIQASHADSNSEAMNNPLLLQNKKSRPDFEKRFLQEMGGGPKGPRKRAALAPPFLVKNVSRDGRLFLFCKSNGLFMASECESACEA